jgi:hypothetical protein
MADRLRWSYAISRGLLQMHDPSQSVVVLEASRCDENSLTVDMCSSCGQAHTIRAAPGVDLLEVKQPYLSSVEEMDRCRMRVFYKRDSATLEALGGRCVMVIYATEDTAAAIVRDPMPFEVNKDDVLVVIEEDVPVATPRKRAPRGGKGKFTTRGNTRLLRVERFPSRLRAAVLDAMRTDLLRQLGHNLLRLGASR